MGKVLIILVLVLTAVFATIAFVIQNRSGEVPEVITRREKGIDHGNLYAYALNYGIKEISRGNVTDSETINYDVEVPALGGRIEDITYTFYTETFGNNGSGDGTPIHGTVRISPNNSSEHFLLIKPDGSQITRSDINQYGTEYAGEATSLSFRTTGGHNSLTVCGENFNITNNVFYEIESDNMRVNLYNATSGKGKAMGQWCVEITALGSDFSIDNESYSCNGGGGTPSMITYVDIDATTRLIPYDEHDAHTSQARIKITYGTQAGEGGEGGVSIEGDDLRIHARGNDADMFKMTVPDPENPGNIKIIDRHNYENYTGEAFSVRFQIHPAGGQHSIKNLEIDGDDYPLEKNITYEIISDDMQVVLLSSNQAHSYIDVIANNAILMIDDVSYTGEGATGGDLVIDPDSYTIEIVYWSE